MTHPADFVDLRALLRQLAALPVFSDTPHSVRRGIKLDVGRSQRFRGVGGHAYYHQRRLRINIGRWVTAAEVAETMLHELVHLSLPVGTAHNERFRRTLARAAREAWGVEVDPNPPAGVWHINGRPKLSAYVLDDYIRYALQPLIESGAVRLPEPAPKTRRVIDVVSKRAAHAARMLTKAERRLKLARTVERKWRAKVRYYERVAAKKGK